MKSYADDLPNVVEEKKKPDALVITLLCLNLVVGIVSLVLHF